MSQILKRLGISRKMGRQYIHSPDKYYSEKLGLIEMAKMRAYYAPERYVFYYLDEMSFYRQPEKSYDYEIKGNYQPLAFLSTRSNTRSRVIAGLNIIDGSVVYNQKSKIGVTALVNFYYGLSDKNPDAEIIYVAEDNWPVHFHPDVLACLQPQNFPFPVNLPRNWPTEPTGRIKQDELPIQILRLPTYASWCNPIEKLWRELRQEVLYLHRLADEWQELKARVNNFLADFEDGSPDLLRYVGLLPIRGDPLLK